MLNSLDGYRPGCAFATTAGACIPTSCDGVGPTRAEICGEASLLRLLWLHIMLMLGPIVGCMLHLPRCCCCTGNLGAPPLDAAVLGTAADVSTGLVVLGG